MVAAMAVVRMSVEITALSLLPERQIQEVAAVADAL